MAKDSFLNRAMSFILPIIIDRCQGEKGQELEVTLENGRIVLNSAFANYSFGSLHKVWTRALGTIDLNDTDQILLLGGGVGSVPNIIHDTMKINAHITMLEHDSEVIRLGQQHFGLQGSDRLKIVHKDAFAFCQSCTSPKYDLILIDLFKDLSIPEEVGEIEFWNDLQRLLGQNGRIVFNTILHDDVSRSKVEELKVLLSDRYGSVQELVLFEINHVFIIQVGSSV